MTPACYHPNRQMSPAMLSSKCTDILLHNAYSKSGRRITRAFRGQARCSYQQAAFLSCSYLILCRLKWAKVLQKMTFLVQAGMFLCFQAGRSSVRRSSASDLTVSHIAYLESLELHDECVLDSLQLCGDDGQDRDVDTIELIKTSPRTALG